MGFDNNARNKRYFTGRYGEEAGYKLIYEII